jgi:hypothetical protein
MTRYKRQKPAVREAHPIVKLIWDELEVRKISHTDFALKVGINPRSLRRWRDGDSFPPFDILEAALQELGYRISITKELSR